ncbi:MAG: branched-chain amino acid ABC transporter permease [Methanosarcinales archaeon]|nr:branched-chain amino acid ABC transporter permease [ANME-2 cluster archaeon]MDF1532776.1 branched-chain amino acid ABC transporter permease [ANME-2 cluster archaeon]MDW7775832.1 branched-chain amino acid ABC transporter permease [Methanosarcinales archaeon]
MIDYLIAISLIIGIYAIFSIGLNLEWGFTGLINFGHVGFMAIGAYTTVLMNQSGAPLWLSMASGVVLASLFGLLVGIPTLRLREDYLAIVTIGFSEIVRLFLLNEEWLTRGPMGLFGFDRPFENMISFDYNYFLFILVFGSLAVIYLLLEKLVHSPWGRVLKSIREDEDVASALGKDVFRYKIQVLMIGSAIAGLAGAFLAFDIQYINPRNFIPMETFYAWIIVVLGGSGRNKGTIIGAIIVQSFYSGTRYLQDFMPFASHQMAALRVMVIGLLLVLLMMYKPQGLLGRKEELTLGQ